MGIEDSIAMLNKSIHNLSVRLDQLVASGLKLDQDKPSAPSDATPAKPPAKTAGKPAGKGKVTKITLDMLRALAVDVSKNTEDGKEKVVAALQRHGVAKLNEMLEERYADLHDMLIKVRDEGLDPRDALPDEGGEEEDEDF